MLTPIDSGQKFASIYFLKNSQKSTERKQQAVEIDENSHVDPVPPSKMEPPDLRNLYVFAFVFFLHWFSEFFT